MKKWYVYACWCCICICSLCIYVFMYIFVYVIDGLLNTQTEQYKRSLYDMEMQIQKYDKRNREKLNDLHKDINELKGECDNRLTQCISDKVLMVELC